MAKKSIWLSYFFSLYRTKDLYFTLLLHPLCGWLPNALLGILFIFITYLFYFYQRTPEVIIIFFYLVRQNIILFDNIKALLFKLWGQCYNFHTLEGEACLDTPQFIDGGRK